MKKEFENKVINLGIYDTKKYRYVYKAYPDRGEIQRLPIKNLDTTASLDGWETVKTYK